MKLPGATALRGAPRGGLCLAALAVGCLDQYQRHTPPQDAATRALAPDAPRDAPSPDGGAPRRTGVDPVIRDAFDGRGVELGPLTSLEGEVDAIAQAGGARPLELINGQLVHVGSGARPGGDRAIPVLRFTPQRDGASSARSLLWLSLGAPGYRPGETSASNNNTTMVVCTRDQGDDLHAERATACGLIWSDQALRFERQVSAGAAASVTLIRSPVSYNRFVTIAAQSAPAPRLTLRQWEMDLSFETADPIEHALPCAAELVRAAGRTPDVWLLSQCQGRGDLPGARRALRVAAINLNARRDVFAPYVIDFGAGALAPGAGAAPLIAEPGAFEADQEEGAALFVNRRGEGPSASARDVVFVRLYRDGAWAARRIAEGTEVRWAHRRPGGGWLVGLSRGAEASGGRVHELLRLDEEGRRLALPLEYSRGSGVSDVGYGVEPSGCGLWVVDVAGATVRLRRIELCPPPR